MPLFQPVAPLGFRFVVAEKLTSVIVTPEVASDVFTAWIPTLDMTL